MKRVTWTTTLSESFAILSWLYSSPNKQVTSTVCKLLTITLQAVNYIPKGALNHNGGQEFAAPGRRTLPVPRRVLWKHTPFLNHHIQTDKNGTGRNGRRLIYRVKAVVDTACCLYFFLMWHFCWYLPHHWNEAYFCRDDQGDDQGVLKGCLSPSQMGQVEAVQNLDL